MATTQHDRAFFISLGLGRKHKRVAKRANDIGLVKNISPSLAVIW